MVAQLGRHRSTARSFIRRPGAGNDDTTIALDEDHPPPLRRPSRIARAHTLSRPERGHPLTPLLNPDGMPGDPFGENSKSRHPLRSWWKYSAIVVTFWSPPSVLAACGMHSYVVRQF